MKNTPLFSGFVPMVFETQRLMRRRFEQLAQAYELTAPQWRALAKIFHCEETTQIALAQALESDAMTVSRILDRLEMAGLIERFIDPRDRRAKLVRLTARAQELMEGARPLADELYREAVEGLSDEEVGSLITALGRINANLGRHIHISKDQAA